MRIVVTGTPGVGKTTIGRVLAKRLGIRRVVNETEFALSRNIGKWDRNENELVVPPAKLRAELNRELSKEKDILVEGHMLCEIKLKVDAVVLLRLHPELLEARLSAKGYRAEKVQDNVFCEGIDYCRKHAERNYGKKKITEVYCRRTAAETADAVVKKLEEKKLEGV